MKHLHQHYQSLLLCLLAFFSLTSRCSVHCLSQKTPLPQSSSSSLSSNGRRISNDRRQILHKFSQGIMSSFFTTSTFLCHQAEKANAACLSGDTSPDCIGVYKVPIDDAILPYTSTPEQLDKFAPGIKWVEPIKEPPTFKDAVKETLSMENLIKVDVKDYLMQGQMEKSGQILLDVIPRLIVCNRKMERENSTSTASLIIEANMTPLIINLQQIDIMIGQALRGQMGSITFAQIQILESLKEAIQIYDDLKGGLVKIDYK